MRPDGFSRRPSLISEMASHFTILRPRDTSEGSITMSAFGSLANTEDKIGWKRRIDFLFRTICFCLGPGNIWRFPRQVFLYGSAGYLYLYTVYTWTICTSLLFLEISLSQYFGRGFARIFTLCPLMEGLTLSMAIYGFIANMVYSFVGVYSFVYLLSAMHAQLPHSYCYIRQPECIENYTNQTNSPEYIYFHVHVVQEWDGPVEKFNWRIAGLLLLVWTMICFVILFRLLRIRWIAVGLAIAIIVALFLTAIAGVKQEVYYVLNHLFVPKVANFQLETFIYPLEQSLVSLGLGVGPLTSYWTLTGVKFWSQKDCLFISGVAFLASLLSAAVFISGTGVIANKINGTVDFDDINLHIVYTHLFNRLYDGLGNFTTFIIFLVLFCSCLYTLVEFIHMTLLYINSYFLVEHQHKRTAIITATCIVFYIFTNFGLSKVGYLLMISIDKIFIPTALLIILSFELILLAYYFGVRNLCDDIEFMLGFVPNYYLQITWYFFPVLVMIFSLFSIYLKLASVKNKYDVAAVCITLMLTLLPIIYFAVYRLVLAYRQNNLRSFLRRRETQQEMTSASAISAM